MSASAAGSAAERERERSDRADASPADPAHGLGDRLKHAFRMHPAGIALITAATATGPVGLTASSVASVAVDLAALSFSVTRATGTAGALLATPTFAVQFLGEQHAPLAQAFAHSGAPRFTPEQGWSRLPTGEPYLPDAPAVLRCRALHTLPVGSSTLVVAEVLDVRLGPDSTPPLLYRDRTYLRLGDALPMD